MMQFKEILIILLVHWLADFILQTHDQAINKSSSNKALLGHTITYSLVWWLVGALYVLQHQDTYQNWHLSLFVMITFVAHTVTDWFTSRLCKKFFSKQDYHNGFVVVGFDQILHYTQLFICYIWLS